MAQNRKPDAASTARLRVRPVKTSGEFERITIDTHRDLVANAREIARRVQSSPDFSVMFLSNPVLALEEYGIKLSREMQHHVLETLRHPPRLRARRKELEERLEAELGAPAKPTDAAWMAALVFKTRKMAPRDIENREPVYKPPLNAEAIARLQSARPKGGKRYPAERRLPMTMTLAVAPPKQTIRRMDLDAPLPGLEPAEAEQETLSLEQAWFYKDDQIVRDAVELGQIMRRGFPFRTPAEFREIAAGDRVDAFRMFIRSVELKGRAGR